MSLRMFTVIRRPNAAELALTELLAEIQPSVEWNPNHRKRALRLVFEIAI